MSRRQKISFDKANAVAGAQLVYGLVASPYSPCLLVADTTDETAIVFLGFCPNRENAEIVVEELKKKWQPARVMLDLSALETYAKQIFDKGAMPSLRLLGTVFQHRVWQALLDIPSGATETYGTLAERLNSAPRAVGRAVGSNPISFLVPCHRVLGSSGALHGYRWGVDIKQKILDAESGR